MERKPPCIVCLSHLGWDSIWQRPHHILSRLARRYPVIYVNEPELSQSPAGIPYLSLVAGSDNLSAWQPFFPDNQYVMENWRSLYIDLVQKLLLQRGWVRQQDTELVAGRPLILWF
ncbi:MAG TPA: hypothetical protein VF177_09235 [Anaerolineae bacterium]